MVQRDDVHRIINAYRVHIRNRYVCPTCPSAIWEALKSIKAFVERMGAFVPESESVVVVVAADPIVEAEPIAEPIASEPIAEETGDDVDDDSDESDSIRMVEDYKQQKGPILPDPTWIERFRKKLIR